MKLTLGRTLLVSVFVASLAVPGWAADESQKAEPKQEKAMKSSVTHETRDEVKKIQEALKNKGEDPGNVDGVMGKKTKQALRDFQKTNKLGVEMASASAKPEKK
jgi:peptidoglycan hydrolase-like protein with peptidoglycan-binding domain